VDFLEANPEYAMIATDVVLVDSDGNLIPDTSDGAEAEGLS
jgi:hypothetical protein